MRPSFPTKTFPNHFTIVTGLRPGRHGIVDNAIEDARRPEVRFTLGDAKQALDPFWWDEAEPIWVTAEKAGVRTATMFWPGSEVAIRGVRPSNWARYDEHVTNRQRVETLVDWLRRPEANRPRFATLYFDTVDTAGHVHGPDAAETNAAVAEADLRIGELAAEAKALGQPVNFVITSDHGMIGTSPERVVRIDTLVDATALRVIADGAFLALAPVAGREAEADKLLTPHAHMQCRRKDEMPARFAYGRHPRVPPILCLAEPGWLLFAKGPPYAPTGGAHGYDNHAPGMAALFVASGPAFRPGAAIGEIDNVDVYPLLARLLGIAPLPNDGDPAALAAVMLPPN